MDPTTMVELVVAIGGWIAANKGIEAWRRRRHANGNGTERRRNSLSEPDKDFINGCFSSLKLSMENDRLKLTRDLSETIREEGKSTRAAVQAIIKEG